VVAIAGQRTLRQYRKLVRDGRAIKRSSPAEALHQLRKDAKELRYLLELFASVHPPSSLKPVVSDLKRLQDVLGVHQDREVQQAGLREAADELAAAGVPAATILALGSLVDRLAAEQGEARAAFAEQFARFAGGRVRRQIEALCR
jgi:CHAD domain-containing protein